jgi:hypothetical protein
MTSAGVTRLGEPYKQYVKTVPAKVFVSAWDSFAQKPTGIILEGDPRKPDESAVVMVFSQEEDVYLKRYNKRHFETGTLIEYVPDENAEKVRAVEESSDDELREILNKPFFSLQKLLQSTTSIPLLFRVKALASELDKSEKFMKAIEARLSELQMGEIGELPVSIEEEK